MNGYLSETNNIWCIRTKGKWNTGGLTLKRKKLGYTNEQEFIRIGWQILYKQQLISQTFWNGQSEAVFQLLTNRFNLLNNIIELKHRLKSLCVGLIWPIVWHCSCFPTVSNISRFGQLITFMSSLLLQARAGRLMWVSLTDVKLRSMYQTVEALT